jgi:hypothetical protein
LSEAKARLLEDLKLLLDERLLCRVQKRALFSLSLSKGHREHRILLANHPGQITKTRARDLERRKTGALEPLLCF